MQSLSPDLSGYGFGPEQEAWFSQHPQDGLFPGRVVAVHRDRFVIVCEEGEKEAELTGNLRFSANSREDFPVVGDWVAIRIPDPDLALIHSVLPRRSLLKRRDPGRESEAQPLVANLDLALLVQAADRDFNLNRLERYLTICNDAPVPAVMILTKTDLVSPADLQSMLTSVTRRFPGLNVVAISNETGEGLPDLLHLLEPHKTYACLGSSGVGKSTLINTLTGEKRLETQTISEITGKGRHTTSHRELIRLPSGALLIDTPGMRELGLADGSGLAITFDQISRLASGCRFSDCTHTHESGCAVIGAVGTGELERDIYDHYLKLDRERRYYETSAADRKRKEKIIGKLVKNFYKESPKRRS